MNSIERAFLLFSLNKEFFAIDVRHILRVIDMENLIKVPKAPNYVFGIVNMEGNVLPIVDIANKIALGQTSIQPKSKIIVLELGQASESFLAGIVIDSIFDVLNFHENQLKPPPLEQMGFNTNTLEGMLKLEDDFFMVLHVEKVFEKELSDLNNIPA